MEREENAQGDLRFGALFVLVYAAALLPPVYIVLSRQHDLIAAVPASVWYLLAVPAAAIAVAYALWRVENRRGVLD